MSVLLRLCLAVLLAAPAAAAPYAAVGDRQLRADVELLRDWGLIRGPIQSWPLPWATIEAGINAGHDGRQLPPHVAAAVERLDRRADAAAERVAVEASAAATNAISLARDFGSLARANGDIAGRAAYQDDNIYVALGAGYRAGANFGAGDYVHFEPSEGAIRFGNVIFYGGFTEQWWGPGQDAALLISNSARPFPKAGFKLLEPRRIHLPVLKWLGPVQFDFFGGVLDGPRIDYRNVLIFGQRLSFSPTRGLEIGLNRTQQLCGEGRPCGINEIAKSFIGGGTLDNADPNSGPEAFRRNQPGNQIAGFDISYGWRMGKLAARAYVEAEAEDFDNAILQQYGRLVGMTLSGPWGRRGAGWAAHVEYADTLAAALFNGTPLEGITDSRGRFPFSFYNNSVFIGGYTYRDRPIGHWADGDSRVLTFAAAVTDTRNRRWYGSVRSVHLNLTNFGTPPFFFFPGDPPVAHRISRNSETFAIITGGVEWPTAIGDLRVEGRYQTDSPNTPGQRVDRAGIEVALRQRF